MLNSIVSAAKRDNLDGLDPLRDKPTYRVFVTIAVAILLTSCAAYGPYHANTSSEPLKSVRGPKDGRYKLAFIEFGDQGSALDTSQRTAALRVIHEAKRPLLFVYIHGWQNNANSGDVCRFEHFIDTGNARVPCWACVCQRKSFGVTAGYGATIPLPCWLLSFACASR